MLHQAGFLHNDVQMTSILVEKKNSSDNLKVKLGGFAKVMGQDVASSMREASVCLYRAPEVLNDNIRSTASDVWGLGVTLYVLSTGRFPFASKHAIVNRPLEWSQQDRQNHSAEFVSMVDSMLQKEVMARPNLSQLLNCPFFRGAN